MINPKGVPFLHTIWQIVGHQMLAWALGMTVTVALLDTGNGFTRDHPPLGWRLVGLSCGPIALTGFLFQLAAGPFPYAPSLTAPFALTACLYSVAWFRREGSVRRRSRGLEAVIVGVPSMLLLMLSAGPEDWSGGIVIGAYTASAALLGGLSSILLTMLTAGAPSDEVTVPATPFGIPARVTAAGLTITLMAALEFVFRIRNGSPSVMVATWIWLGLSLAIPLAAMAVGHGLFPRFQRPVWFTAVASALVGQGAILFVILMNPGLVPPTGL